MTSSAHVSWSWLASCRRCEKPHQPGPKGWPQSWRDPIDGHFYQPRLPLDQLLALRYEHDRAVHKASIESDDIHQGWSQ